MAPGVTGFRYGLSKSALAISIIGRNLMRAKPYRYCGQSEAISTQKALLHEGPFSMPHCLQYIGSYGTLLSKDEPLLLRDEPFLSKERPFLLRDEPFLSKEESFLLRDEPFLSKERPFLSRDEPFLSKDESFLSRVKPFLSKDEPFLSNYVCFCRIGQFFFRKNRLYLPV